MSAKEYKVAKGIYCVNHDTRRHGVAKDRYFIIRIQINGKRPHQGVGWASEGWTLAKVQELVVQFKKAARTGVGPTTLAEMRAEAEYKAAVDAAKGSVKELFSSYIADQQKRGKKCWKEVERVLLLRKDSAANFFGEDTKAKDITSRDVMLYLRTFYEKGSRGMANHARVYLHGAFKFGIGNEFDYTRSNPEISFGIDSNPVSSIPKDKSACKVGQRHLTVNELKTFLEALEHSDVSTKVKNALKLIIYFGGQRVLEVLEAPKIEFDLNERIWTINSSRVKNGRTHVLPISDRTVDLIAEQMSENSSHFLFPHETDPSKPFPNSSINRAVRRICERNDIERFTPRDLRRTCRTLLADEGLSSNKLNKHFNHGDQGVGERHYDRSLHMKEKIEVMNRWNKLLDKWLDTPPSGDGSKVIKVNFGAKRAS